MGEGLAHAKALCQDGAGIAFRGSEMMLEKQKEAGDTARVAELRSLDFIPGDLEVIRV